MPHVLALDWDAREIRYLLGMTSGRTARVLALGTLPLVSAEGEAEPVDQAFADQLKELLSRHRAGHSRVLVALPRSSVELLYLTVPPAKDEELPELVFNLAVQQSPSVSEQTRLDFLPTAGEPGAPRSVLAAALGDDQRQRILDQLAAAGLTPQRMVLRSLAAISLFRRLVPDVAQTSLVIYRVGQELELSVIAPGRVGFTRTVRLPGQLREDDVTDRLIAEAKRTVLAAPRGQIGDEGIRQIFLLGSQAELESVAVEMSSELSLPAEVLDPLGAVEGPELASAPQPERFAPLLGILLDEASGTHAIDFLHPRRPPHPWTRWRMAAMAGGAVAVAILALVMYVWGNVAEAQAENQQLAARLRELNELARRGVTQRKRIEAIAAWKNREVNWLDELRDLSERFPGPRDAVVLRMSMRPSTGAGGLIDLQGLVRDPKVVVNMERQVRDSYRAVRSRRVQQRTQDDDYTWLYETSVSVAPRRPEVYRGPEIVTASAERTPAETGEAQQEVSADQPAAKPAVEPAVEPPQDADEQPVKKPATKPSEELAATGPESSAAATREARP